MASRQSLRLMRRRSPFSSSAISSASQSQTPFPQCRCPGASPLASSSIPVRAINTLSKEMGPSPDSDDTSGNHVYVPTPVPETRPRWSFTPPAMVSNVKASSRLGQRSRWKVNESPKLLDDVLQNMLGRGAEKWLDEETKWLAVTHKSFEQGARGFNDKLAYMGKRIVDLQTSLALLSIDRSLEPDELNSQGDIHPQPQFEALRGLPNLSDNTKRSTLYKARLAKVAEGYGLHQVMRWRPRRVENLQTSGIEAVLVTTMYAIVGAVALQRGAATANQVARDAVLQPLGFIR